MRALVDRLAPVIERRVAAVLWQRSARGRDARQERRDMVQAVFLSLFESDARALRAWRPDRGTPLEAFVSLLAHRQVISILRNGRTTPWADEPTDPDTMDAAAGSAQLPEQLAASREHVQLLLDTVREQLSPLGLEIFQRLVIDQEPIDQLAAALSLTPAALYQWRSRLTKQVQEASARILAAGMSEQAGEPRSQKGAPRE
jgi:DNA-directed RNA polymerase specialized sigma24 family protein